MQAYRIYEIVNPVCSNFDLKGVTVFIWLFEYYSFHMTFFLNNKSAVACSRFYLSLSTCTELFFFPKIGLVSVKAVFNLSIQTKLVTNILYVLYKLVLIFISNSLLLFLPAFCQLCFLGFLSFVVYSLVYQFWNEAHTFICGKN